MRPGDHKTRLITWWLNVFYFVFVYGVSLLLAAFAIGCILFLLAAIDGAL